MSQKLEFLGKKCVHFFLVLKSSLRQNVMVLGVEMAEIFFFNAKKTHKKNIFLNTKKASRIRKNGILKNWASS